MIIVFLCCIVQIYNLGTPLVKYCSVFFLLKTDDTDDSKGIDIAKQKRLTECQTICQGTIFVGT